jgi:hypothetical protein
MRAKIDVMERVKILEFEVYLNKAEVILLSYCACLIKLWYNIRKLGYTWTAILYV